VAEEPVGDVVGCFLRVGRGEALGWVRAVGVGVGRFEEVVGAREELVCLGEG
jgi:hypothetical protein